MKKLTNIKKSISLLLALALYTGSMTACSSTSSAESADSSSTTVNDSGNTSEPKVIRVGTGNSYNPACYLDDEGNVAGYDPAVLQAVDELLPQYTFTYETFDFQNVLLALESNKVDLAAHQYEWNEEREESYLFGEEGYTVFDNYIWVLDEVDTSNIHSLEDFSCKTVQVTAGDNKAFYLDKWNSEHPDKVINLDYTAPATQEEIISYYKSGKWAFLSCPKKDIELYNESYAGQIHFKLALDEPLNYSNTYFLYRKDYPEEAELQKAVDGALKELKESGKLAEISTEYWGGDYTKSNKLDEKNSKE